MEGKMQDMKEAEDSPGEKPEASLEDLFRDLDDILEHMNNREASLEDSFALYEEGMKKVRQCNEKLDRVEKKMLVIAGDGSEEPFEAE